MEIIIPVWAVTLIGALIAVWGAFQVQRYVAFKAASAKFRAAILSELGSIYPTPAAWPNDINAFLRSSFTDLQIAVADFSHHVPWWSKRSFNRAWLCFYCAYPDKTTEQCYHHYLDSYDPFTFTQDEAIEKCKNLFHANVRRLLSYAKET